jgi:hypothetical protein
MIKELANLPRLANKYNAKFAIMNGPEIASVDNILDKSKCRKYFAGSIAVKANHARSFANVACDANTVMNNPRAIGNTNTGILADKPKEDDKETKM